MDDEGRGDGFCFSLGFFGMSGMGGLGTMDMIKRGGWMEVE